MAVVVLAAAGAAGDRQQQHGSSGCGSRCGRCCWQVEGTAAAWRCSCSRRCIGAGRSSGMSSSGARRHSSSGPVLLLAAGCCVTERHGLSMARSSAACTSVAAFSWVCEWGMAAASGSLRVCWRGSKCIACSWVGANCMCVASCVLLAVAWVFSAPCLAGCMCWALACGQALPAGVGTAVAACRLRASAAFMLGARLLGCGCVCQPACDALPCLVLWVLAVCSLGACSGSKGGQGAGGLGGLAGVCERVALRQDSRTAGRQARRCASAGPSAW